ncbi:hypothetical protein M422DRAFT_35136 [Sphaerobolus stellatus SS14]|uniref:Multifunctional tryptophan biosynthesis protein n=1 Tax=Sphaerobolus stellatus (strain SS14) TaxID=990650 RepID=A0A0C9UYC1_SPHS4|nr:hypothetical protein M422DRAFT_35136 [Sphaerobolus stellatus SS14]
MSSSQRLPTILEKIHEQRLKDIEQAKSTPGTRPTDLETLLSLNVSPPQIALVPRLRQTPGRPALMAEVKRASPSKGDIAPNANAAQQALSYALAGASVISVLTEPKWFKGSLLDMRLARQAIDNLPNRPAILRKDFIVDEYQIQEARLFGADTVLLIVAMLPIPRLKLLYAYAKKLEMEPLVEVNNAEEMKSALDLGAKVIGVNNRNLHNFEVDMGTTTRLVDMVKDRDVILCALSGIQSNQDVQGYIQQGVSAVLVGESLMRAPDPGAFIRYLLDIPEPAPKDVLYKPLVKVSGVKTPEFAIAVAEAGADFVGIAFAPNSRGRVSLSEGAKIGGAIRQYRASAFQDSPTSEKASKDHPVNEPWFALHASRLSNSLSYGAPLLVGIFQGQSLDEILEAVSVAQLDLVQLQGSEPIQWAQHIPVPVIRAFHVRPDDGGSLYEVTRPGLHHFLLFDSVGKETVAWEAIKNVVEEGKVKGKGEKLPVILAGGLTTQNVSEIVRTAKPWAVDITEAIENDLENVKAFIKAAKAV